MSPISKNIHLGHRSIAFDNDYYLKGILAGDITVLSQAISLVESSKAQHRLQAAELIDRCLAHAVKSKRIGITGVPGVGKSTFIEAFGLHLLNEGYSVAVLAIDPSSNISKGSILGDKTRMYRLSQSNKAFIRPSPSMGSLGGVAQATRESIVLCEAAGFNCIIVETVGVGQSETEVHAMVDFFLLLMLSNAGDELQGIKRGIMEMADLLVINKADGPNIEAAKRAKREYLNALHLFSPHEYGWESKVALCSAIEGKGIDAIWKIVVEYFDLLDKNKLFEVQRSIQLRSWFEASISRQLSLLIRDKEAFEKRKDELQKKVLAAEISPSSAAISLIDDFFRP